MEKMAGKNEATYGKHSGFCLETQVSLICVLLKCIFTSKILPVSLWVPSYVCGGSGGQGRGCANMLMVGLCYTG